MKWTTHDEQWGSLPRQGEDVLVVLSCGQTILARIGFGDTEWILERGCRSVLAPGDRWLPLSAITPERMEAVEGVIESSRAVVSMAIPGMNWTCEVGAPVLSTAREALSRIDALEKK